MAQALFLFRLHALSSNFSILRRCSLYNNTYPRINWRPPPHRIILFLLGIIGPRSTIVTVIGTRRSINHRSKKFKQKIRLCAPGRIRRS